MDIDQLFSKFQLGEDFTGGFDHVWLHRKTFPSEGYALSVRPVSLAADIPLMHRWASHPHARQFWQMNYTEPELYRYYLKMLRQKLALAFLLYLDEIPVAQTDVYQVTRDETAIHYQATPNDYGIHLLMSPYKEILPRTALSLKGLSVHVLVTMLDFLFSFDAVESVIAEPDSKNKTANDLAQKAGYRFMKEIQLSYKIANLYSYGRDDFLREHP